MTRRRFMTGAGQTRGHRRRRRDRRSRRSASRSARSSRRRTSRWQAVGPPERLRRRHLRRRARSRSRPASARPARRPSTSASATRTIDTEEPDEYNEYIAISTRCCTSAARCASSSRPQRFICPCHGGVYDFAGQGRSAARRCARSTASRPASPTARSSSARATRVNSELERFCAARPRRAARRHLAVPLPAAAHDAASCRSDLGRCRSSPHPRSPSRSSRRPSSPARRNGPQTARSTHGARGAASTSSTGSTSAPSLSGVLTLDAVPQGAQGDQLVLHARLGDDVRLPLAGDHRRLPGDVLHAVADRRPTTRSRHITNDVFLGEFVRGMHKWGSSVMVDPDLPAHGADLLLRRLQVPARAELGDRRRAADPDDGDGLHRLPAAVRPALLLGDDRRRATSTAPARSSARTWPTSCAPARSSAPPRCRASTRSTCCSSRARSPR